MKFVSLGKERAHRQGKLDTPPRAILEPTKPIAAHHQIHTYTELRQQIHEDLRSQHPEWVQPNGESPMCDSYEARLMELLDLLTRRESTESLDQGVNRIDTVAVLYVPAATGSIDLQQTRRDGGPRTFASILRWH